MKLAPTHWIIDLLTLPQRLRQWQITHRDTRFLLQTTLKISMLTTPTQTAAPTAKTSAAAASKLSAAIVAPTSKADVTPQDSMGEISSFAQTKKRAILGSKDCMTLMRLIRL